MEQAGKDTVLSFISRANSRPNQTDLKQNPKPMEVDFTWLRHIPTSDLSFTVV